MENLSVTSFTVDNYCRKSLLCFKFTDIIKIKIYLPLKYSIVKEVFNDYFEEVYCENPEVEPRCCFTFGKKHLPLFGAVSISNQVSSWSCEMLEDVRDYDEKRDNFPIHCIGFNEYTIMEIAKRIIELLKE